MYLVFPSVLTACNSNGFVFYTNYESRKAHELNLNPYAALVFWWKEIDRSVRIEGMRSLFWMRTANKEKTKKKRARLEWTDCKLSQHHSPVQETKNKSPLFPPSSPIEDNSRIVTPHRLPFHSVQKWTGTVVKVSEEESEAYFNSRPLGSRIAAWTSRQSQTISSRSELVENYNVMQRKLLME